MEALARGYLVRYTTLDDLVRGLRHADALGKLNSKLARLQRPQLLIVDEAGCAPRGAMRPGGQRGPPLAAATAGRRWGQPGA
jgi:DNA replication protein DnaC